MFAYGEEMSTDPLEAQFIKSLTAMKQPKRVLEIGMFTGYGAAAMLEGCATTQVVSLDIDPYLKGWVETCLKPIEGIGGRLSIVTGPALDTMARLPSSEQFDLVFVDANKSEYKRYVEILLERGLLADGCQIIADNTLYCGIPYTDPSYDSQPQRRAFGDAIRYVVKICNAANDRQIPSFERDFNAWIKAHDQLKQVVGVFCALSFSNSSNELSSCVAVLVDCCV